MVREITAKDCKGSPDPLAERPCTPASLARVWQQELRPGREVLDIVAEVIRGRQGLAAHRGLASHQGTHQQTTGQKSERPEVMFREVHSVAHRSRMTVAVPMRDVPRGQSLGVSSSSGCGIFRKIGKTRKIAPARPKAYSRTTAEIPWPPPTQSAATERFIVPEATLWARWTSNRAPLAPIGCPTAIAPPSGFNRSGSSRSSFAHASVCAANASLISKLSQLASDSPRSSSFRIA